MECNREEALRAKSIAESKLEQQDLAGAKKFALKAQNLYPQLEGISQFLLTIDVLASAEKIDGEEEWYTILSVSPSDSEETIKKQFRKLALLLHPDKNKSVGANGAFELIKKAWSLLSDTGSRYAYDRRRGYVVSQPKAPFPAGGPRAPPSTTNQGHNFNNRKSSVPKTQNNAAKVPKKPNPAPRKKPNATFWTKCDKCLSHYEHVLQYLNCRLRCPKCNEAFLAVETDLPTNTEKSTAKVPVNSTAAPRAQGIDTFWTICNHCMMSYEHHKIYLNRKLLCPNCKNGFMALETAPPVIKAEKKRKMK